MGGDTEYIESCKYSILAASTLSLFLNSVGAEVTSGNLNKTDAERMNVTHIDCDSLDYNGIIFKQGEVSNIEKDRECYIINVGDCKSVETTERFILGVYAHSHNIRI